RASSEPARMTQQVPDSDWANEGLEEHMVRILFRNHHPIGELRNELCDRIVEAHLAFVHEHHDRRAREHLRHRRDPKHVVVTHRFLRIDIGVAEEVLAMNLACLVRNDADEARQFVTVQVRLYRSRDFGTGGWITLRDGGRENKRRLQQTHKKSGRDIYFHIDMLRSRIINIDTVLLEGLTWGI